MICFCYSSIRLVSVVVYVGRWLVCGVMMIVMMLSRKKLLCMLCGRCCYLVWSVFMC